MEESLIDCDPFARLSRDLTILKRLIFDRLIPVAMLGFFLARFFYELDPLTLSFLGSWPGPIVLAALIGVAYRVARIADRLSL